MTTSVRKIVLHIEDDPNDAFLLQRALRQSKLPDLPEVRLVKTIDEACSYLQGTPPHNDRSLYPMPALVLTDLRLPGKSGIDFIRWLRQQSNFQKLPVVMLTGSALDTDIEIAYQLGADFCLIKPQDFQTLVSIILALSVYWIPPSTKGSQIKEIPQDKTRRLY